MATAKDTSRPGVRRLKTRPQFLFVRHGQTDRRRTLVIQSRCRADGQDHIGVGFTTTRKIGNSVTRNRARRRLREAARLLLPKYGRPGTDYVFIARLQTAGAGWQQLLDDMENALISLGQPIQGGPEGP
jgi:ribonuclease P protein component